MPKVERHSLLLSTEEYHKTMDSAYREISPIISEQNRKLGPAKASEPPLI